MTLGSRYKLRKPMGNRTNYYTNALRQDIHTREQLKNFTFFYQKTKKVIKLLSLSQKGR